MPDHPLFDRLIDAVDEIFVLAKETANRSACEDANHTLVQRAEHLVAIWKTAIPHPQGLRRRRHRPGSTRRRPPRRRRVASWRCPAGLSPTVSASQLITTSLSCWSTRLMHTRGGPPAHPRQELAASRRVAFPPAPGSGAAVSGDGEVEPFQGALVM